MLRACLVLALLAAACGSSKRDSAATGDEPKPELPARDAAVSAGPTQADDPVRAQYERLLDSLPSPCGRAESLRKALQPSSGCPRASFAARYLEMQLARGATDDQATLVYENRYVYAVRPGLFLEQAPHKGNTEAPIVIVEFLDYACSACKALEPRLDELLEQYGEKLVIYYKQAPLTVRHPNSRAAARAALAAHRQGKFAAMHELLFARPDDHRPATLRGYARQLELDLDRFERDFEAADVIVAGDLMEAERAEVARTPTLVFNGRLYTDFPTTAMLTHWIEEELAALAAR